MVVTSRLPIPAGVVREALPRNVRVVRRHAVTRIPESLFPDLALVPSPRSTRSTVWPNVEEADRAPIPTFALHIGITRRPIRRSRGTVAVREIGLTGQGHDLTINILKVGKNARGTMGTIEATREIEVADDSNCSSFILFFF